MPMLIKHIDAIARQKQRDVLYVVFHPPASGTQDAEEGLRADDFDWKTLPIRQQIIDWLDPQGIGWKPCGHFANECLMMGYRGQIYIDHLMSLCQPFRLCGRFSNSPMAPCGFQRPLFSAAHSTWPWKTPPTMSPVSGSAGQRTFRKGDET